MNQDRKKITGILLSGGKSSRMGREKGNIRIGKKLLYQYPLGILDSLCDEILISTCDQLFIEEDHEQVCDEIPGIGPIGGIYTCLKRSSNHLNIVLSYDLPMVNPDLFRELISFADQSDVVLPAMSGGKPEPLCGVYNRSITEILGQQIGKKIYAVHKVLPLLNSKTIILDKSMPFYHPNLFLNINREEDLGKLSDIG